MIVPIKCFSCGKELANLYRVYIEEVKNRKIQKHNDPNRIIYLTGEPIEVTPEKEVMDMFKLNKMCCRNIIMTVVEI
jgi:DNA-directed RNA polymerase subunit N (RpoN/RPB10)